MKRTKILAHLCAVAMIISMFPVVTPVKAAEELPLPFKLLAPSSNSLTWEQGYDSPTTMTYAHSKDSESGMTEFLQKLNSSTESPDYGAAMDELAKYGYSNLIVKYEVDWAIDDPEDGWHYTPYWDTFGVDEESGTSMISVWDYIGEANAETTDDAWITRAITLDDSNYNYEWYGSAEDDENVYMLGLKSQLKDDQYEFVETDNEGEKILTIDFKKHTMYARSRFTVEVEDAADGSFKYYSSPWSDVCGYGKDFKAWEPIEGKDIEVPDISDFQLTDEDFNGYPVATYELKVSDELEKLCTDTASRGGNISLVPEMRFEGFEFEEVSGSWEIVNGKMNVKLSSLFHNGGMVPEGTKLQLRAYYFCSQYDDNKAYYNDIVSGYSDVLEITVPELGTGKSIYDTSTPSPEPTETSGVLPTIAPTLEPTVVPTLNPTLTPTKAPVKTAVPTAKPSTGNAVANSTPQPKIYSLDAGASRAQVDTFVSELTDDNDPAGTSFGFLFGRQKKVTKNSITLVWLKPVNATSFAIYGAKCGKANQYQYITSVTDTTYTQNDLPSGTYHKYLIAAFDSSDKLLGVSNTIHITTKGGKFCNIKKVKVKPKKKKLVVKNGKALKVKGTAVKESKKLKVDVHRPVRYESSDKTIATVTNSGKIVGKQKGSCMVYVYAQNGAYSKIKLTVK